MVPFLAVSLLQAADAAVQAQAAEGQKVYMMVCFACHQPTGMGMPNMFPPLAGSDWANAPKADRIIRIVLHGLSGPVTVKGLPFNTPAPIMPPQGAMLNDTQIANVLTYIRNSFGNAAGAVSPDEVKAIRAGENRTLPWTQTELQKVADR